MNGVLKTGIRLLRAVSVNLTYCIWIEIAFVFIVKKKNLKGEESYKIEKLRELRLFKRYYFIKYSKRGTIQYFNVH